MEPLTPGLEAKKCGSVVAKTKLIPCMLCSCFTEYIEEHLVGMSVERGMNFSRLTDQNYSEHTATIH